MKIALLAPRFPPGYDGVGDHASWVTESLVRAGHDVLVITETPEATARCSVVHVDRWNLRALERAWRAIREHAADLTLVEYTPFNFGGRTVVPHLLAALCRLRRIRVATFMHEGFYRPRGTNPMPPLRAFVLGVRDALMVATSNAVYPASVERSQALAAAVPMFATKFHAIPIGANIEPAARAGRAPAAAPPYRLVMFDVVAPRRRIALAIEMIAAAAARGIPMHLTVLGRVFDEAYAAACVKLARDRGIADSVTFSRERERADVTHALLAAHLAVHALFEGTISSSGSLLAVLAHGVPLLAVRTPRDERAFDEIAIFTTEDPHVMLEDALGILRSSDGGAALGDRARSHYERDFAWDRIAERAVEIACAGKREASYARG